MLHVYEGIYTTPKYIYSYVRKRAKQNITISITKIVVFLNIMPIYVLFLAFFSYWEYTLFRRFMYSTKLFLPDTHGIIHKNINPLYKITY